MDGVQLSLVLAVHQPPGTPDREMQEAFRTCWEPLVLALQAHPTLHLGLAVSGPALVWLERAQPAWVEALRGLVRAERVELLTCGWGHPFLAGLSPQDALGQLRLHMNALRTRLGARPRGAALAEGAWDPEVVGALSRAELAYALLDERALEPGETPAGATGWFFTESQGHALRLLPTTGSLHRPLGGPSPADLARNLARRARAGGGVVVVQDSASRLGLAVGAGRLLPWLAALGRLVGEQAHWLRTVTPSAALARLPTRGRVYPAPWIPPHMARWVMAPAQAARLAQYQRAAAAHPLTRRGPPLARSSGWQASLSRYEEANRLHKYAALTSQDLQRLRTALESPGTDPQRLQERLAALQQAERLLYEAQASDPLWHGPSGGLYDGRARAAAWAGLAQVEALVRRALGDPDRVSHLVADVDGDTREEVLVRNPRLSAVVDPEAGGGLSVLLFYELPGQALNTLTRRDETLHEGLAQFSTLPTLVDGEDQAPPPPTPLPRLEDESETEAELAAVAEGRAEDAPLAEVLGTDPQTRTCFQDRFLREDLSLAALRRGQPQDIGDFYGAPYKLESAETDGQGRCVVLLTREGLVQVGAEERLVGVLKRVVVPADEPWVEVRYEVNNRSANPLSGRFGVELNLNLDSAVEGVHLHLGPGQSPRPVEEAGELEATRGLALVHTRRKVALGVQCSLPARLWHYPIECVSRRGVGMRRTHQGVCLLLGWDFALWGTEKLKVDLRVDLRRG